MRRELAIEFSRVTESAALAGYKWLGRGDKNTADGAAVNAMRIMLNQVNIDGTIVIGEGEIDEAPMLYIGEKVGTGRGDAVDIAVDPIEGTRMTAMGQANALAVLAVGDKGCFLNAPDMYMEKLIVGPGAKGTIDLNLPLADNLRNVAAALGKPLSELTVTILAKPRTMPLSQKCSNSACAYLLFRTATLQPQFSPVCQTAKLTCCTVLVARRKAWFLRR